MEEQQTLEQLSVEVKSRARELQARINAFRKTETESIPKTPTPTPRLNVVDEIFENLYAARTALVDGEKAFEELTKRIRA